MLGAGLHLLIVIGLALPLAGTPFAAWLYFDFKRSAKRERLSHNPKISNLYRLSRE